MITEGSIKTNIKELKDTGRPQVPPPKGVRK